MPVLASFASERDLSLPLMPKYSVLANFLVLVSNVSSASPHDLVIGVPSEAAPVMILQARLPAADLEM